MAGRLLLARQPRPPVPDKSRRSVARRQRVSLAGWDEERPLLVCLFGGIGGTKAGELQGMEELGRSVADDYDSIAINHDVAAVRAHKLNHPKVIHHEDDIEKLDPRHVLWQVDASRLRVSESVTARESVLVRKQRRPPGRLRRIWWLSGSPPCQAYSRALGGRPKNRQLRATIFYVLKWMRWGRPLRGCLENVEEFLRSPEYAQFLRGVKALRRVGLHYRVEAKVIDAADLGAAQHRRRAYIQFALDYAPIAWPTQTHSDPDHPQLGTEPWNGFDTILEKDEPTRSVIDREKLLVPNTLARYSRGARNEWGPFWGPPVADVLDAFVTAYKDAWWPNVARHINNGLDTPEAKKHGHADAMHHAAQHPLWKPIPLRRLLEACDHRLWPDTFGVRLRLADGTVVPATARFTPGPPTCSPSVNLRSILVDGRDFVLPALGRFPNEGRSNPPQPAQDPLNTIVAGKESARYAQLELRPDVTPFLIPRHRERDGQEPRYHRISDPHPTIACSAEPALAGAVLEADPLMVQWHAERNEAPRYKSTRTPGPTITASDDRALGHLYLCITSTDARLHGGALYVDIDHVRLHPTLRSNTVRELARGQGFPEWFIFPGSRKVQIQQIGNAVHVWVSRCLFLAAAAGLGIRVVRLTDYVTDPASLDSEPSP